MCALVFLCICAHKGRSTPLHMFLARGTHVLSDASFDLSCCTAYQLLIALLGAMWAGALWLVGPG